ncbi:PRD domain-containing protein [Pseudolactococcus yaeyamensis]
MSIFVYICIQMGGLCKLKVVQSLNQNALLIKDDKNNELIALGKGIGFGKKKGDTIDKSNISSFYRFQSTAQEQKIIDELKEIDENVLTMAEDVAVKFNKELNGALAESFVFTLASHIQFSIERNEKFQISDEAFLYEFKYLYPKEYALGKAAVQYLNERYKLNFPESEVTFFTLHFVNALTDTGDLTEIIRLNKLMEEILDLVSEESQFEIDKDSVNYSRFILHLRYFLMRQLSSNEQRVDSNLKILSLYQDTAKSCPREMKAVEKIKRFLKEYYGITFNSSEELYLLLHVVRLLGEEN